MRIEKHKTIMADPPWAYSSPRACVGNGGRGSAGAAKVVQADVGQHYPVMSVDAIKALPVSGLAADKAHLYLWTTPSFMVEAYAICRAWGFEPKTIITWVKTQKNNPTLPSMKTGYWFRSAAEQCVFAVRGSMRLSVSEGVPTWFAHPRLPHSVKPDYFREQIVERCSPGPYLELFARKETPNWDVWGNEVHSSIELSEPAA